MIDLHVLLGQAYARLGRRALVAVNQYDAQAFILSAFLPDVITPFGSASAWGLVHSLRPDESEGVFSVIALRRFILPKGFRQMRDGQLTEKLTAQGNAFVITGRPALRSLRRLKKFCRGEGVPQALHDLAADTIGSYHPIRMMR